MVVLSVGASISHAARLMPPPSLPEALVRATLAGYVTQPAEVGEIKIEQRRLGALQVEVRCEVELVLKESLYREAPREDPVFRPITDRLTELDVAQQQLRLVPKDFIATIGGQKSGAALSFLQHAFLRTTFPTGSRARETVILQAVHSGSFFDSRWDFTRVPLAHSEWRGRRMAEFKSPLVIESPEFKKELEGFLDAASKASVEVDEISDKYLAKCDAERAAILDALPIGAVMGVPAAIEHGEPLYMEVKSVDARSGAVAFQLSTTFASRPPRRAPLTAFHRDPARELRAFIERRRAKPVEEPVPAVAVAAPEPTNASTNQATVEESAKQVLLQQAFVELVLDTGAPVVRIPASDRKIGLARVADTQVRSERDRFAAEMGKLSSALEPGKVYRGTIGGVVVSLGVRRMAGDGCDCSLQLDAEGSRPLDYGGGALEIEREHAAFRLALRSGGRIQGLGTIEAIELTGDETGLRASGRFGDALFLPAGDLRLVATGRILSKETAAFLDGLRGNRAGVYRHGPGGFEALEPVPAPTQSGLGALFGGFMSSVTSQFPATTPVLRLKRDARIYLLRAGGHIGWLPLKKEKSSYTFDSERGERGYFPRLQGLKSLPTGELDDDIHAATLRIDDENVCALFMKTSEAAPVYFLIQLEP
ncbi:MAG: hypothetical protein HYV96_15165 [Opitutae bacterium]|nr:hypothetical protein [Opitutae bacterium]